MKLQITLLTALVATTAAASAAAISVNFRDSTGARETIAPTTAAGIGGELNWNNTTGADDTLDSLVDDLGLATTASVTWGSGGNTWRDATANTDADAGVGNAQLMRGYIDDGNGGSGVDITVTGIPYPTYTVIVYFATDTPADGYLPFEINGSAASTTGEKDRYGPSTRNGTDFPGMPNWDDTNSITVSGLSGDLVIDGLPRAGPQRASVAGIQIIAEGPAAAFVITEISYDTDAGTVTLTWNSIPGTTYGVNQSVALTPEGQPGGWSEIDDLTADGVTTSYVYTLPNLPPENLNFRISILD